MNKAVALLSGGLDSLVSLDIANKSTQIIKALNFDYGQKAFREENTAAKNIAEHYKIELETIELSFLKNISNNALTNPNNKNLDNFESVWIPNRNGLFVNIAACFCEKLDAKYIIIGANKQEAKDFIDNSKDFVKNSNAFFKYSTLNSVELIAPCIDMDKIEIVNYAIENSLPLNLIKSCYDSQPNKKHCGKCMSCKLLYNAIKESKKPELIKEIF